MQKEFYKKFLSRHGIVPSPYFESGRSSSVSSGQTRYYALDSAGGDSNAGAATVDPSDFSNGEVEKAFLAPDGIIDLFNVVCNVPAGTGEFFKLTVYKNGAPTALVITINYPNTSGSDSTHFVTTEEGDLISVKIEGSATTGSFQGSWHVRITPNS